MRMMYSAALVLFLFATVGLGKQDKDKDDDGPRCRCPAPDLRNLTEMPNSSKACGYELQKFKIPGQVENCRAQTVYKCKIVALDEETNAKEWEKCDGAEGNCRRFQETDKEGYKAKDPSARDCFQTP